MRARHPERPMRRPGLSLPGGAWRVASPRAVPACGAGVRTRYWTVISKFASLMQVSFGVSIVWWTSVDQLGPIAYR